jgi:hypothetical protein
MSSDNPYLDVFTATESNTPLFIILMVVAIIGVALALFGKFFLKNWQTVIVGAVIAVLAGGSGGINMLIHENTKAEVIKNMQHNVKSKYNADLSVETLPKAEDRDKPNSYIAKFIDGAKTEYRFKFDKETNEPSLVMEESQPEEIK